MTRYYNENPQVRHWMEKCAMLQQELDIVNEETELLKQNYIADMKEIKKAAISLFEKFNALPWYKKMFYKFEI